MKRWEVGKLQLNCLLMPIIALTLSQCSQAIGPVSPKEEVNFEGSIDAESATLEQPIEKVEVSAEEVVLGVEPEEVKNETSENLPPANEMPPSGEAGTEQPPAPSVPPPTPSVPPAPVPAPFYPAQCAEIKKAQPTAASGNYKIYLNPAAPERIAIDAYCDMSEDGGGWTLLLNYVHQAATNPELAVLSASLPLLVSDNLGTNEASETKAWGHASNALLKSFAPKELRFYCRSSANNRILHFKTNDAGCLTAGTEGSGSCIDVKNSFATLSGHTAVVPQGIDLARVDRGDFALTNDTFSINTNLFDRGWSIRGDTGASSWECDFGSNSSAASTIHRIYFR